MSVDDSRCSHATFAQSRLAAMDPAFAGVLGFEDSIAYSEYVRIAELFGADSLSATTEVVLGLRASYRLRSPPKISVVGWLQYT